MAKRTVTINLNVDFGDKDILPNEDGVLTILGDVPNLIAYRLYAMAMFNFNGRLDGSNNEPIEIDIGMHEDIDVINGIEGHRLFLEKSFYTLR